MRSISIVIMVVALVAIDAAQRSEGNAHSLINMPHLRFDNNQYKRMLTNLLSRNVDTEKYEDLDELARNLLKKREGTDQTSDKLSPRDIIVAKWYLEDEFCYEGEMPTPEGVFLFAKALVEIVSGDGIMSEPERKWIVGKAAIIGATQDVLDRVNAYTPDGKQSFEDVDTPYIQSTRLSLIYNGFKAAAADTDLAAGEVEAIHTVAKKLGVTDKELRKVRALYEENENLRQKRAKILYPHGGVAMAVETLNNAN